MENDKNPFLRPLDGVSLDHSSKALEDFVSAGNYTVDEVEAAYFILLGIGDITSLNEKSVAILEKMKQMEKEGYPVSRFARAIETMGDIADAPKKYREYVTSLALSEKEKNVLQSLLDRPRAGELSVHVGDEVMATFSLPETIVSQPKNTTALLLLTFMQNAISTVSGASEYEVWFSD